MVSEERPKTPLDDFENACYKGNLNKDDLKLIEYIRYIGVFTQPQLQKSLNLKSKPPVLSIMCNICREIGLLMPDHFAAVRKWSEKVNDHNVRWDGNLICAVAWNIDGVPLMPEYGTSQYHTFVVHKELFQGLE